IEADYLVLAIGHSAYDTYRMLIKRNVQFRTKNFAIGHRIEHEQKLINKAQWGREKLAGVKAAEYFLTNKTNSGHSVYSFCMCPGGTVVPAAAFGNKSVVNGMSQYKRDGKYANSGLVVGVSPDALVGQTCKPVEILDWMDNLEEKFYAFSNSYELPAMKISSYMHFNKNEEKLNGSYSLGMRNAELYKMVPKIISKSISESLKMFSRKINGFDKGIIMGLENKTSSPLQVIREKNGKCEGFENLYFVGEGSGYAGGIISSAADGVKCAIGICE
ncbi:MAG: FAD-dependent oxidoreductase, partial [Bacteroidota bacterium]|nr:FAD-dependent oxidoreductase [Bacteroidota bacterium]